MEFSYDKIADALYIYINRGEIKESKELSKNIVIDYNEQNKIYGIEIINFSKINLNLNELIKLSDNELVANVTSL
ncbi:MAG: DUF2283 domain-containing protein [Candidatus Heimdallarchaeota archaeon]|nr:DUF2283 domain-containing protein [Candidatus Heimdallarchaeota archaeon]